MKIEWKKITLKILALALFVVLLFVGFFLGIWYQNVQFQKVNIVPVSSSSASASQTKFFADQSKLSPSNWKIFQNSTYNYSIEVPTGDLGKFYQTKEYNLPEALQKVSKGVPVVYILEIRRDYYDGINSEPFDWEFGDLEITKEPMAAAINRTKGEWKPHYEVFTSNDEYTLAGTKITKLTMHQLAPVNPSAPPSERIDYLTYDYFAEKQPYTYHLHGFNSAIFRRIYDSFGLTN